MSKKIFKLSLSLLILVVLVSGCTLPWKKKAVINEPGTGDTDEIVSEETTPSSNQMKKFSDYAELKKFLEENSSTGGLNGGNTMLMRTSSAGAMNSISSMNDSALSAPESFNEAGSGAAASADYSNTNNQVAGVDEADIIKTDGTYIYALVRNELKIIKANPASEASVISTITFKSRPEDIFINGTNLAVFGSDQQIYTMEAYRSFRRQNPYTFFKVFDISNPADPKLVRDLDFEGSYTDARLIGDYAYLFTSSYGNYIEDEPLVPRVISSGTVLANDCGLNANCFMPDVYYFDIPYDSYSFSNVTAINLKDNNEAISGESYLMNSGQNLYVSQKNIYITYTQYLNEYEIEQAVKRELVYPNLISDDQDKITKIEAADSYILSKNEKQYKVATIIDHYLNSLSADEQKNLQASIDSSLKQKLVERAKDMEKTIIHKIGINGRAVEYRGMGEVSGQVLNQFSMDENGEYFRIATTRNQIWSRLTETPEKSFNNIYVLNNELKTVGSLENLATDERIYSARFMGERVYLVTFKQTDPLYVISLSDPSKPSVLGAIKIPGYSTYLHPADKNGNKLIGFGRDAEENSNGGATVKGLKLTLFDFTDLSQPKELDSYLIGDSSSDSIALQDHKAFLYSESKNILSIPAVLRENNKISFAGALVFNISENRFSLKGQIDHSEGGNFSESDYWGGYGYYDNSVKRSLYINDQLYTFSNKFLKINNISDLTTVKNIILTIGTNDYIITPTPTPTPLETPVVDASAPSQGATADDVSASLPAAPVDMVDGMVVDSLIPPLAPDTASSTNP